MNLSRDEHVHGSPAQARADLRDVRDEDLIVLVQNGQRKAFDELVARYKGRLFSFILRMVKDPALAEELTQETLIRVYLHADKYREIAKFSTWVYTIASNLARNELRNRKRSPLVLYQTLESNNPTGAPIEFEDPDNQPDTLYHQRHLRELVDAAVDRLGETHRDVFVMRELEGKSYEEIAEITRTNLGTVKSRLNRARSAFVAEIQPHLG